MFVQVSRTLFNVYVFPVDQFSTQKQRKTRAQSGHFHIALVRERGWRKRVVPKADGAGEGLRGAGEGGACATYDRPARHSESHWHDRAVVGRLAAVDGAAGAGAADADDADADADDSARWVDVRMPRPPLVARRGWTRWSLPLLAFRVLGLFLWFSVWLFRVWWGFFS